MNRQSLFFKLNILFVIALLATLIAGGSIIMHIGKQDRRDMLVKSRLIANEYRLEHRVSQELLNEFGFTMLVGEPKHKILHEIRHRPLPPDRRVRKRRHVEIFPYQGHLHLHIKRGSVDILIMDQRSVFDRFAIPSLILLSVVVLLVLMYLLLRRALLPLRRLQSDIELYGEGRLGEYTLSHREDEISRVADAFYHSATKLGRLSDSRMLFIRNLFHELNTPVTKGKILSELVESEKTKSMLEAIFSRLAMLLKELGRIEQITSENYTLSRTNVRIVDLLDEANDLLFLEEPIATNITDEMISADFASMSIVFKNLIDNAHKYGENLQVLYSEENLSFVSEGEKLEGDFRGYLEPFGDSTKPKSEGMGLGLYIVNEVLRLHGMELGYEYREGRNIFTISL